jgi:5-methylcytosine-specific restriction endonuclease McrA
MKLRNRLRRIKIQITIFHEACVFGFDKGFRYYRDTNFRRQSKKNMKNRHKYGSFLHNKTSLREAIIRRDGRKCNWCSDYLNRVDMTLDHITPISRGGTNKKDNIQILCNDCHIKKTKQEDGQNEKYASNFVHQPFQDAFKRMKNATQTTNKS